jgi:hypothetical protein
MFPWSKKSNTTKNKDSHFDKLKKLNPGMYWNQTIEYKPTGWRDEDRVENNQFVMEKFDKMMSSATVNPEELRSNCHRGIPQVHRPKVWRLLSGYVQTNLSKYEETLDHRRKEYARYRVQHYEENFEKINNKRLQEGLSTILKDVDRTLGETRLFQSRIIRESLTKILYIYHARNIESGYAQGMNDIAAPFLIVFLQEYIPIESRTLKVEEHFESQLSEKILLNVEADTYWCFTRLLSYIKSNYTPGFPDVIEMLSKLNLLIQKLDPELDKLLKAHNVRYYDISFQWFLCLLLRQFSAPLKFRLLDFYFTEIDHINEWLVYIGAAFLMKFSNKLKEMNAYDKILMFFTTLKTENWGEMDINMLLGEAHIYKNSYNYSELNTEALKAELAQDDA